MDGVSIIVCCYNSALRLPKTLECLAEQRGVDDLPLEIIVIDNASTDSTTEVAFDVWRRLGSADVKLRVVPEPTAGLSYARARGIKESQYEYVLFCDDDNLLSPDFVRVVFETMNATPAIGALGGCGTLDITPKWLAGIEEYYAIGSQGVTGDVTETRGCLYGAGLTIRKSVFETLTNRYHFDSLLTDRRGESLISGGDIELTFAIRLAGFRLYYDERLVFQHAIDSARLTKSYFIRLVFFIGYSWMALYPYHVALSGYRARFPSPNWIDVLHLLKQIVVAALQVVVVLLSFRSSVVKVKIVRVTFIFGQLYYALSNYGHYQDIPTFIKSVTKCAS